MTPLLSSPFGFFRVLLAKHSDAAMRHALMKLARGVDLSAHDMEAAMGAIVGGRSSDDNIELFLLLLRKKGETILEVTTAATVMRRHSVKLSQPYPDFLDTCGTGGDAQGTLNVSTLASITVAACGIYVAKHGNRSVSSVCGSADLLEGLGVNIDLGPEETEACMRATGFGFLFAPKFHPATRHAMAARRRIKGKTLFNLLGPLSNPAGAGYQVVGVYDAKLVPLVARVLADLGARRALVVHSKDGLDEISLGAPTLAAEVQAGVLNEFEISPEDMGVRRAPLAELRCATKEDCIRAATAVLTGETGPKTDFTVLNAGAALFVCGRARSFHEGVDLARQALSSGRAFSKLQEVVSFTRDRGVQRA